MSNPLKAIAWCLCRFGTRCVRLVVRLSGRKRRVDVLIYKVDRLGDWFLAEPAIQRIVAACETRGESVVVWASRETGIARAWHPVRFPVEEIVFEPKGWFAKLRRALAVMQLLATYEARVLVCLRYSPEPIRDYVLSEVKVHEIHAASWLIRKRPPVAAPDEIVRHHALLASLNLATANLHDLLPALSRRNIDATTNTRVVIAPFSSATIKDWADDRWCTIASRLAADGLQIELWVGPDQKERALRLAANMTGTAPHLNVAVRSGSLAELEAAISSAALVISVDTFAAHLAAALDAPLICLIGGGQFGSFGPWQRSPRQVWLHKELPCFNCNWKCTHKSGECMEGIMPDVVLRQIASLRSVTANVTNTKSQGYLAGGLPNLNQ